MRANNAVSINARIKGGKPCVTGTRIPVADLVFLVTEKNIDPKKIVTEYYTQLSLDVVLNALEWNSSFGGKHGKFSSR